MEPVAKIILAGLKDTVWFAAVQIEGAEQRVTAATLDVLPLSPAGPSQPGGHSRILVGMGLQINAFLERDRLTRGKSAQDRLQAKTGRSREQSGEQHWFLW